MVPEPPARTLRDPVSGEPGVRLEYRDGDGALLGSEHRLSTVFAWWGEDGLPPGIGWGESGTVTVAHHVPGRESPGRTRSARREWDGWRWPWTAR